MKNLILITFLLVTTISFAQETATVFIARKKIYTGYYGPIKVFMDGKLICRINNNQYSIHNVPTGQHKFSVQWEGKNAKEGASEEGIDVDVEAGKEYYIKTNREDRGIKSILILQEVTANTWKKVKEGLDPDDCL